MRVHHFVIDELHPSSGPAAKRMMPPTCEAGLARAMHCVGATDDR